MDVTHFLSFKFSEKKYIKNVSEEGKTNRQNLNCSYIEFLASIQRRNKYCGTFICSIWGVVYSKCLN